MLGACASKDIYIGNEEIYKHLLFPAKIKLENHLYMFVNLFFKRLILMLLYCIVYSHNKQ